MGTTPLIGRRIVRYKQVQSTNDLIRDFAEKGETEGLVITAEEQLAGRGRMGRRWRVPPGTSLQLSILLRPALPPHLAPRITQMAALAVARLLESELGLHPVVKWSNDVLLPATPVLAYNSPDQTFDLSALRKVVGILPESSIRGDALEYVILGIGLNVNFSMSIYPELAPFATTLQDQVGHPLDLASIERALFGALNAYYARVQDGASLLDEYRARLTMLNTRIRVGTPNGTLEGIARDVAEDGALLLEHDGARQRLYAGDVTILKPDAPAAPQINKE